MFSKDVLNKFIESINAQNVRCDLALAGNSGSFLKTLGGTKLVPWADKGESPRVMGDAGGSIKVT